MKLNVTLQLESIENKTAVTLTTHFDDGCDSSFHFIHIVSNDIHIHLFISIGMSRRFLNMSRCCNGQQVILACSFWLSIIVIVKLRNLTFLTQNHLYIDSFTHAQPRADEPFHRSKCVVSFRVTVNFNKLPHLSLRRPFFFHILVESFSCWSSSRFHFDRFDMV